MTGGLSRKEMGLVLGGALRGSFSTSTFTSISHSAIPLALVAQLLSHFSK